MSASGEFLGSDLADRGNAANDDEATKIRRGAPGGLAAWQARRVTRHIEANIDKSLRTPQLAAVAVLSTAHFSRAFTHSFGVPPQRYVMRRRLERAQRLLMTTNLKLGQIAFECGLADQSHFTRLFLKLTGETPGSWRRARGQALGAKRDC